MAIASNSAAWSSASWWSTSATVPRSAAGLTFPDVLKNGEVSYKRAYESSNLTIESQNFLSGAKVHLRAMGTERGGISGAVVEGGDRHHQPGVPGMYPGAC